MARVSRYRGLLRTCVALLIILSVFPRVSLGQGGTPAVSSAVREEPLRDLVPDNCWKAILGFTAQDLWQGLADTAVIRLHGIPGLKEGKDDRPLWGPSIPDSLRRCVARWASGAWRGLHLLDAARVKLGLQDDTAAAALIEQYLQDVGKDTASAPFAANRSWALMLAATDLVMATPARWAASDRLLTQLDRIKNTPVTARWFAHFMRASAASQDHDDVRVLSEVDALYALWHAYPQEVEAHFTDLLVSMLALRVNTLIREDKLSVARAAVDSTYTALAATGHAGAGLQGLRKLLEHYGTPAVPIVGTWWYRTSDSGRVTRPEHGKVTLVVKTEGLPLYFQMQYERLRILQELSAKYGPRGLVIVQVDETEGFFDDSLFTDPKAEAERRRQYYLDEVAVPGILTIYHNTEWHQVAGGKWRNKPSPRDMAYPLRWTIVDRQGNITYMTETPENEDAYLDLLARQLLGP